MVYYECQRCCFNTNQKSIFRRHLLRKNICPLKLEELNKYQLLKINNFDEEAKQFENIPKIYPFLSSENEDNIEDNIDKNKCKYCNKVLSSYKNKWRHEKTCKKKEAIINNSNLYENKCLLLEKQNKELTKIVEDLIKKVSKLEKNNNKKTNKNNKHNNNSFNTVKNNKIEINNYGSENIDYITEKVFKRLLNTPLSAIPKLIELKHFHPEHPENHNIKITNIHDKFAKIYKDKKWLVKHKKDVIQELVENGYADFEEFKDLNEDQLAEKIKEKYEIMEKYYIDQEEKLLEKSEISVINGSNKF